MTFRTLVGRSLRHFWRSHLVVAGGVATAVAVLGGALLVGDSVRGTLRDLAVARLGAADLAVMSPGFFGDTLAARVAADPDFADAFDRAAPLVVLDGFVTAQASGRRAGNVRVYGVDDRFWRFHGRAPAGLEPRTALVSQALADETGVAPGDAVLVRVELPSDVPLESLHGRKDDPGRSIRATVSRVQHADELGEFTLSQSQGRVRAVYVALEWLRQQLEIGQRANTLVIATRGSPADASARLAGLIRRVSTAEDVGLTVQTSASSPTLIVGSDAGLIDETRARAIVEAASSTGRRTESVLTYLANSIRSGTHTVPYSLVTARDLGGPIADRRAPGTEAPIVLNEWAARELSAAVGDPVELDYYLWVEPGQLVTRTARFTVAGVVPIEAVHRELAPTYPGITDSPTLDAWDPPFPIDLRRVRPVDEAYWKAYRTTPKAFVAIEDGQRLWGSRYGRVTSIRIEAPDPAPPAPSDVLDVPALRRALADRLDPVAFGLGPREVRAEALAAATGVTDFGEYFVYFSFFLVASALVLAALFFMLGVEERAREIGLLGAVGAPETFVRGVFLAEAFVLSAAAGLVGIVAAVGYGAIIVWLLGTWWVDAVGTSALRLHVAPLSLVLGYAGGVGAAMVCTWIAIRRLRAWSPRALLAGAALSGTVAKAAGGGRRAGSAVLAAAVAAGLAAAGFAGVILTSGAFFGAAFSALVAGLLATTAWYHRPAAHALVGHGPGAILRLGLRNATERPARSALSITVVASAVFILLAVDAFRKDVIADTGPTSGVGGYALVAESLLPVAHDLATPEGREAVGLSGVDEARFDAFRLRPGDDASCLNLYRPTNPRVLGVGSAFIARDRFRFGRTLAVTEAERANPWRLLEAVQPDGAVPVIVDANSLTYVLHASVGDVIEVPIGSGTARLRVVAALADTLFQRELLVSEADFVRLFPDAEGYRFWLVDAPADRSSEMTRAIEDRLSAFGVDATPAADRLAEFHRVENTYLTTFQSLGGLGLLLGTVGLSAVLLRNVVSRRRELALLRAVGYQPSHIRLMLLAETGSLLVAGLLVGGSSALLAGLPAIVERGGGVPVSATGAAVVGAVLLAGFVATVVAAQSATRQPLLDALRSE